MTIVRDGVLQCKFCKGYFVGSVSFFVHIGPDGKSDMNTMAPKICPYCKKELKYADWGENIMYNPTLQPRYNKMSEKEAYKKVKESQDKAK
ncbi:MAG: hypothetical protein ABII22_00930 [Candidatus Micrarchaeota archaeon]